uniref:E3 ubiquitin-protein ligase TRIM39-like n=1 Tax=Scleropages formosus TaxID=113540 RepID=A0A8C9SIF1_SCLFO
MCSTLYHFTCSLCLEVFNNPVSTPCGHSFCVACISSFWAQGDHCLCPKCEKSFLGRPELCDNTFARDMAEQFKRMTATEVQQMIQDRVKKLEEIKESVKLSKVSLRIEDGIQVLTNLIQAIQQTQVELIVKLEEKQRIAERRAEGLIKELEKEIIELQRRNTELDQLSNTEDYIHVLQRCSSLCTPPHTMDWSEITVYADLCISTIRAAVTTIENHLNTLEHKLSERGDVTLDPWTANPWLDVSADGKQVKDGDKQQCFPDNPERFDTAPCVLGKEGFSSGRHYWEVEVVGKTAWDLGVARVSVKRKGVVRLSPEDGFWTVCLRRGNEYRACDEQAVLLHLHEKPRKLGVYVDCEEGQVSFYNVDARSHIYTFSGYNFTEKLLPLFNPDMNDDGNNRAPLVISLINHKGGDEFIL